MTALRVAICLAALALGAYALERHSDVEACKHALGESFAYASKRPAPPPEQIAEHLTDRCRGTEEIASAAAAMTARAPAVARELADAATRRAPQDARAWLAVAFATRGSDRAVALRAQRRALALNPYAVRVVAGP